MLYKFHDFLNYNQLTLENSSYIMYTKYYVFTFFHLVYFFFKYFILFSAIEELDSKFFLDSENGGFYAIPTYVIKVENIIKANIY